MSFISLGITISAQDLKETKEPCYVQQQQDGEDTVPCSGDQALLNELLRLMGFDIPVPEQPEEYSSQIKVKPKNSYTNLNISFSDNVTTDGGRWEQSEDTQSVSISSSDFVPSGAGGYVDLAAKLNLVETDKIKSARWVGDVYDADLSQITISSIASVDSDNRLQLKQAVNGELLVTVSETYQLIDTKITPREGESENAYQSSVIIDCDGVPTRYEINVPDCYRNSWPGSEDGGAVIDDPPPEFVDPVDAENEWCLCGNHKLQARYPKSREEQDISNICYGGPCDQITEPDCVPDDREDGDEYC
jgi:hypothetical protein